MAFEVSKHQLVPKHSKVSDSEKKNLEKTGMDWKALPKILKNDPAISKLDLKSGEMVKIERKSKTAGTAIYYRAVANE